MLCKISDKKSPMVRYRVDISEPAENDLRDIVRYISVSLSEPIAALNTMDSIEEAIQNLRDMPRKYPLVMDDRLAALGYRKQIVKNYIVFFTINEKHRVVDVERIFYMRRDWLHIL